MILDRQGLIHRTPCLSVSLSQHFHMQWGIWLFWLNLLVAVNRLASVISPPLHCPVLAIALGQLRDFPLFVQTGYGRGLRSRVLLYPWETKRSINPFISQNWSSISPSRAPPCCLWHNIVTVLIVCCSQAILTQEEETRTHFLWIWSFYWATQS